MIRKTVLAAILAALTSPALAEESKCASYHVFFDSLYENWDQRAIGMGLTYDGQAVEVWTNRETGAWTILATKSDGQSCTLARGATWAEAQDAKRYLALHPKLPHANTVDEVTARLDLWYRVNDDDPKVIMRRGVAPVRGQPGITKVRRSGQPM